MGFNIAYMAGHFTVLEFVQAVLVQGVDKDVVIRGEIDRGGPWGQCDGISIDDSTQLGIGGCSHFT